MEQGHKIDYRQLCRLQNQNYQLKQELEDLNAKYENLKKEQHIWEEIHRHNLISPQQPANQDSDELSMIKEQFVAIVKQKQQQQQCIRELRQKVDDMKYTIQQMRQLSQKQERFHLREVEFFQMEKLKYQHMPQDAMGDTDTITTAGRDKDHNNGLNMNKLKSLLKQAERKLTETSRKVEQLEDELAQEKQANKKNFQKLQKCSQIAKQMEQYYTNELEAKQRVISHLETEIDKYSYQQQSHQYYELPSPHTKLPSININEDCSSLKCSSIVSEYHHQHLAMGPVDTINFFDEREKDKLRDKIQDKYRDILDEIKASHQKQLTTYHEKIRYLTLKVEALEAEKVYLIKNSAKLSHLSHSQNFIMNDHLQSIQSLSQSNHNKSLKNVCHRHSVNLKLSKTSANDSFTQFTPKSQISQSVVRESSQSKGCENGSSGIRPKLTAIKTPNKTVQKTLNLGANRNSCSYQRVALGQRNLGGS